MKKLSLIIACLVLTVLVVSVARSQSGGSFTITKSVIGGGGGRTAGGAFTLDGTMGEAVAGTTSTGGSFNLTSGFWGGGGNNAAIVRSPFDFDGDSKSDISIFRPGPGEWWVLNSSNGGNFATQFGASTDKIVPVDFTGDGKTDVAYWRPSTGFWFVLRSEDFTFYGFPFGANGDVPAPADYDGDGKADAAVFRPSTATSSSSNKRM